jgi:sec-independent protein translocase protein TatA
MSSVTYFGEILGLGTPELIIILAIILLLFGGSKLPQLSRSIGTSIKELRKGVSDGSKEEKKTSVPTKDTNNKA